MTFKYGTINYLNAKVGDPVRFVPNPQPGQPGALFWANDISTSSGILKKVQGTIGCVELRVLPSTQVVAEGGSASGIRLNLPVTARGSLRIL